MAGNFVGLTGLIFRFCENFFEDVADVLRSCGARVKRNSSGHLRFRIVKILEFVDKKFAEKL